MTGILQAYVSAIEQVTLSGPTYFHQIIASAAEVARQGNSQENQQYFVLLILTDGIINDESRTAK